MARKKKEKSSVDFPIEEIFSKEEVMEEVKVKEEDIVNKTQMWKNKKINGLIWLIRKQKNLIILNTSTKVIFVGNNQDRYSRQLWSKSNKVEMLYVFSSKINERGLRKHRISEKIAKMGWLQKLQEGALP